MQTRSYLTLAEQQAFVKSMELVCDFAVVSETGFTRILSDEVTSIIVMILRKCGTILQRWHCTQLDDDLRKTIVIFRNTDNLENSQPISCDQSQCDQLNDVNIKCYLCGMAGEVDIEDLLTYGVGNLRLSAL
jgi:hypothetical protein